MKKHRVTITLSDDAFSKLEEIRTLFDPFQRNKSLEIAWLISQEWKRFQEEKREKTPAELVESAKAHTSRLEKKAADYVEPCHDARIIQFPVRRFFGGVS